MVKRDAHKAIMNQYPIQFDLHQDNQQFSTPLYLNVQ